MNKGNTHALLLAGSLLTASSAWAGLDAGAMIRRFQEETWRRLAAKPTHPTPPLEQKSPSRAAAQASTEKIHVSGFVVQGVTRFTEAEIASVLKHFVGKELDTAGIHAAADGLNKLYRDAGFFAAKVFIPPQQVAEVIRLEVYEGYLDAHGIEIDNRGQRIDSTVVQNIIEAQVPREKPMHRADIERALLIVEDLPGITTSSLLYPGQQVGTARLRTVVTDLPAFSGNIDIDNFGNRATGQARLGTTLYMNSPTHAGDQAVARLVTSGSRSNYAYLTYLRPISNYGTRLGASIDRFGYDAAYINNLGYSEGEATDLRVYLTHSLYRSRHGNLNARADLSQLRLDDRNDLGIDAKRTINSATLSVHGDDDHPWINTGLTIFDASLAFGNVDISGNAAYINADRATTRTEGSYARLNVSVSRLSLLTDRWSFMTKINGQLASTNLDTSQKMYLGGATSISGYPIGEAGGDQGAEIFLELRHDFLTPWRGTLTGGLFYEQGWIKLHKNTWTGWQGKNPDIENNFSLKTAGFSLVKTMPGEWIIRGLIGWQIDSNPLRDPVTGVASDGGDHRYRGWLQIIRYF